MSFSCDKSPQNSLNITGFFITLHQTSNASSCSVGSLLGSRRRFPGAASVEPGCSQPLVMDDEENPTSRNSEGKWRAPDCDGAGKIVIRWFFVQYNMIQAKLIVVNGCSSQLVMHKVAISCLFQRFMLIFMNIFLENFNKVISKKHAYFRIKKHAYLCLFFTNFVLIFRKFLENALITRFSLYVRKKDRFFIKN